MQIGPTALPGSTHSPASDGTDAPAPASGGAPFKEYPAAKNRLGPRLAVVALLLLAGTGVVLYALARGIVPGPESVRKAGLGAIARWLPDTATWRSLMPFRATNGVSRLTAMQQQVAQDYSPARPIAAAKRAMAAEAVRVRDGAGTPAPVARNTSGVAVTAAAKSGARGKPAADPAPAWSNVLVSGVIGSSQGCYYARINRHVVGVGDMVDGMTVTAISPRNVTLARAGDAHSFLVGSDR